MYKVHYILIALIVVLLLISQACSSSDRVDELVDAATSAYDDYNYDYGYGGSGSGYNGNTISPVCGNGTIESGEQCDGYDLGTATCASLGEGTGSLSCDSTCLYDVSMCHSDADTGGSGGSYGN